MNEAETYNAWRGGKLVPGRITLARAYLDLPQQSVANVCGTDAETVDLWEQGAEYPSMAELIDLMALAGLSVQFFTKPVVGPGPLFVVPRCWADERGEMDALCGEFCAPAVQSAVHGWPTTGEGLADRLFV